MPGATSLPDAFKRILRKAKLPNIRRHELHHSAASLLLTLNIHPRMVMELSDILISA
jgi:integrase